jgi:hypothetical protein
MKAKKTELAAPQIGTSDEEQLAGFIDKFDSGNASLIQGKSAQKRTISHPEIGSTGHGWPDRVLKPGESMDISGDHISGLYDLNRPDEYTIQLLRAIRNDPNGGFVKSNTFRVTVAK